MRRVLVFFGCFCLSASSNVAQGKDGNAGLEPPVILDGGDLTVGYDMGVNTDRSRTDWLERTASELKMAYPEGQQWGAVFVTVGTPSRTERGTRDFTSFHTLVISMRGKRGGEKVEIGIKDKTDPDDGTETKVATHLTKKYKTYEFRLQDFRTANLAQLYVVAEFVFGGPQNRTIFVNRIELR